MSSQSDFGNNVEGVPLREEWSSGLEDEENDSGYAGFGELDSDVGESLYPETQPLHVQGAVERQTDEEFCGVEFQPDNVHYGKE